MSASGPSAGWEEQFAEALDFPRVAARGVQYAICSTPRSGSHFLGQLLFDTRRFGCPLEYFNPHNLGRWQERARAADVTPLLSFLRGIRTSDNGVFGLKAHFTHLRTLAAHLPFSEFVTDFRHIHIVRRDVLAQAISFERARQTNDWISRAAPTGQRAEYDASAIRNRIVDIAAQTAGWEYFFHSHGVQRLVVEYETLASDPSAVLRSVAEFLGVEVPAGTAKAEPRTRQQRDAATDDWRERFIADMRRDTGWNRLDILRRTPAAGDALSRWWQRIRATGR